MPPSRREFLKEKDTFRRLSAWPLPAVFNRTFNAADAMFRYPDFFKVGIAEIGRAHV